MYLLIQKIVFEGVHSTWPILFFHYLHNIFSNCYSNTIAESSKPCFLPVHGFVSEPQYDKSYFIVKDGNWDPYITDHT